VHCIACGSPFLNEITRLEQIPSSAQYFVPEFELHNTTFKSSTDLIVYQCISCTHVQSQSPLVFYYKDVVTTASLSPAILHRRDTVIHNISNMLGNNNPTILEIGSFQGQYLAHLARIGYSNLFGIENNPESVESGRLTGVNLFQGYILDDNAVFSDIPPADLVLCFNFLEHIPDPFHFLQIVRYKLCSKLAYIYITIPSFEYIRKTNLLQEFVPDHLSYFTVQSLHTLFARCNLQILSIDEINNSNDLEIVAKSSLQHPLPLDRQPFLTLIKTINIILTQSHASTERVAFWGAGHRSLTLISQLNFQFINQIVDSAPFKQGLFCPDTGIPIISPNQFFSQPTDVLFISLPGIYASEVCSQVKASCVNIKHLFVVTGNSITTIDL